MDPHVHVVAIRCWRRRPPSSLRSNRRPPAAPAPQPLNINRRRPKARPIRRLGSASRARKANSERTLNPSKSRIFNALAIRPLGRRKLLSASTPEAHPAPRDARLHQRPTRQLTTGAHRRRTSCFAPRRPGGRPTAKSRDKDGLKNRSEKTTESHVHVVAIRCWRRRPPSSLRSNRRPPAAPAPQPLNMKIGAGPKRGRISVALRLARA